MRIGIAFDLNQGFSGGNLRGIAAFARPQLPWIFEHDVPTPEGVTRLLAGRPDGLIMAAPNTHCAEIIARAKIPVVNLGLSVPCRTVFEVRPDHRAIGEMAARYFLSRSYRNLAYLGGNGRRWNARREGFEAVLKAQGLTLASHEVAEDRPTNHGDQVHGVGGWLKALPKPLALFCEVDYLAWAAAEACRLGGLRVPSDVAILGVDNDSTICELAYPQLSSIQLAGERIGYEGAQLLAQLIENPKAKPGLITVPPLRVVERQSTELMIASDKLVANALKYMREHLFREEDVEVLCKQVGTSRRNFGRRFRACTGETPTHQWSRFRVEEAQRLLVETDLGLEVIASLSGFSDTHQLHMTFKRFVLSTPLKFRQHARPTAK